MTLDIDNRIRRIYSALGIIVETNIQSTVSVVRSENTMTFNLNGGMSSEDIENAAHAAIGLIAHLPDHLKKFFRTKLLPTNKIDLLLKTSLPFQLIADLANAEKHGGFNRNGGWSNKNPVLKNLTRGLRLAPS